MSKKEVMRHQVLQIAEAVRDASPQNKTFTVYTFDEFDSKLNVTVLNQGGSVHWTQLSVTYHKTSKKRGYGIGGTPISAMIYHDTNTIALEVELPEKEKRFERLFFYCIAKELGLLIPHVEWEYTMGRDKDE